MGGSTRKLLPGVNDSKYGDQITHFVIDDIVGMYHQFPTARQALAGSVKKGVLRQLFNALLDAGEHVQGGDFVVLRNKGQDVEQILPGGRQPFNQQHAVGGFAG